MVGRVCLDAGAPRSSIFYKTPPDDPLARPGMSRGFTIPGFYRPTKQWDLMVHDRAGEPIIAIELKSQNGPSYGNNANNRVEEALGNVVDMLRALRAGLLPRLPWTGFVFVIEDDARSANTSKAEPSFLPADPIFAGWSYQDRVRLLCQRLVEEGLYDRTWAVATSRPGCPTSGECPQTKIWGAPPHPKHKFGWHELDERTSGYEQFADALAAEVSAHWT